MPLGLLLFLACLSVFAQAHAAPRIPAADNVVLERLPFRPNDPIAREMSELRTTLRKNPRDQDAALKLAQRYYGLVAEEGDPRYIGYAQAALAPWWTMAEPPVEIQVMRASLAQFNHNFSGAVSDLNNIIARYPQHAQARALRATIHMVQARYPEARIDCQALRGLTDDVIATGCSAMVDGLTGKAQAAYDTLLAEFSRHPEARPDEQLWVLLRLAEISQRIGHVEIAEKHFKQALALNISDTFMLAAYADLLLDQHRPAEVVALLKDRTRSDVLLLRLVFAERTLKLSAAGAREATLAARYAAAQLRGDTVHQQEEARFALAVEGNPGKALGLALENWKVQLEPRDARIVLEAALAAGKPAAAQPVLDWLSASGNEDRTLRTLAQQIKGAAQ
ncbi:tetratricopeptide repeat protein [Actimicrobium antarcticum]|uniref:Outer membrane lipoprotein BamD-like domain-containing protein n=1 Tax=Actimicrobium antarcticum TaxID=1051899 RepID=A0ABP7TEY7_9BURK